MIASLTNRNLRAFVFLFGVVFNVAVKAEFPPTTAATTQTVIDAKEMALRAALDRNLGQCRYNAERLDKVIDDLRKQSGANIVVDWPSLVKANINRDAVVTARLRDIKLSKALELVFKSVEGEDDYHKLAYRIIKDQISITTLSELSKTNVTQSYDIADLAAKESVEEIRKTITDSVDTESWRENGGAFGSIAVDLAKNSLVITQSPENHKKITALLLKLRVSAKADRNASTPRP